MRSNRSRSWKEDCCRISQVDRSRTDFEGWSRLCQQRVERTLDALLPAAQLAPAHLHQAMRYAALGGGKRVRPLLAYAAGEVTNARLERVDRAGSAVELIHAYSLVHDDLPCMDDDVLRRGRPTCHVAFGEATALLVGDALQSLAFQVLVEQPLADQPTVQLAMAALLAQAAGSGGMAGGQAIDLASTGARLELAELEDMHARKTGALIRAAVLLGAYCGAPLSPQASEQLGCFARCAGLAFQVLDDVLDAESDTATLGKTAGKDARENKPTYVSVMGLSEARGFAHALRDEAMQALSGFGSCAARLRELIDFIVLRTH
jgi:farnesyl diphosphate synthase